MTREDTKSNLLRELSGIAQKLPISDYCAWALGRLRSELPFDRALWIIGTHAGEVEVLASFQLDHQQFLAGYSGVKDVDPMFQHVRTFTGTAVQANANELNADQSRLKEWVFELGVPIAMSLGDEKAATGVIQTISIYRTAWGMPFSDAEAHLHEQVAPTLFEGLRMVRAEQIRQELFETWSTHNSLATVSPEGAVFDMEERFLQNMALNFKNWCQPHMPDIIARRLRQDGGDWTLRHKAVQIRCSKGPGSLRVLVMTELGPLGALTNKQFAVAELYAKGYATKAIARVFNNKVSTIENHRKTIYNTLDISSNNELTRCFSILEFPSIPNSPRENPPALA